MNYLFIVLLGILSAFVTKAVMRVGMPSISECEEYVTLFSLMENVRSVFDKLKTRWIIVASVNTFCCLVLAGYYKADIVAIINILFLLIILWVCLAYDIRYEIIPNNVLLLGCVARIAVLSLQILMNLDDIVFYFLNTLVASVALLLIGFICRFISRDSIGMGDVKLLAVLGFYLGVDGAFYTVMASIITLFMLAVILLLTKKANRNTAMPFAPFLLIGLIISTVGYGVY